MSYIRPWQKTLIEFGLQWKFKRIRIKLFKFNELGVNTNFLVLYKTT